MKVFTRLSELNNAPAEMLAEHDAIVDLQDVGDPFIEIFGGNWFLVETLDDLNYISKPPYDIVEWKNNYLMVVLINNNSGGPCYFVPRAIAEASYLKDLETTN